MRGIPHLAIDPDVLGGEPCFAGTDVPVDALFVNLAAGERLDVVLHNFPGVTHQAALAVLREACRLVRERALEAAERAPGDGAQLAPVMYEHDWDQLAADAVARDTPRKAW
jgi:uncharacterized protein (DUF433 family)